MSGYNTHDEHTKHTDNELKNITFGIFFDGTSNNRYNVDAKKSSMYVDHLNHLDESNEKGPSLTKDESEELVNRLGPTKLFEAAAAYKKKHTDDTCSYENDNSNVDRLEPYYKKGGDIYKLYIEGIGTQSDEVTVTDLKAKTEKKHIEYGKDDHIMGNAFGNDKNGIRGKVRKACEKVAEICQNKKINVITFDLFGFSRGCAAAPNFVHEVTQKQGIRGLSSDEDYQLYEMEDTEGVPKYGFLGFYLNKKNIKNIDQITIRIRFVGIFDTVSSYSSHFSVVPNFTNDVEELFLNDVNIWAKKIIHLTAADEHRKNFALTHISANNENRIELSLPGVHSDVGGCYMDQANEKVWIDNAFGFGAKERLEKRKLQLQEEGWFRELELTIDGRGIAHGLHGERVLGNKYSYITLQMMHRFANQKEENESELFRDTLRDKYPIHESSVVELNIKDWVKESIERWMPYWEKEIAEIPLKNKETEKKVFKQHKRELLEEIDDNLNLLKGGDYYQFYPEESELLSYIKKILDAYAFEGKSPLIYKTAQRILDECGLSNDSAFTVANVRKKIPELVKKIITQIFLRVLRHKHLHWSATLGGVGAPFEPTSDWKRIHYYK